MEHRTIPRIIARMYNGKVQLSTIEAPAPLESPHWDVHGTACIVPGCTHRIPKDAPHGWTCTAHDQFARTNAVNMTKEDTHATNS